MLFSAEKTKSAIYAAGFDVCGITVAENMPDVDRNIHRWRSDGYNADMAWFFRNEELRCDPSKIVEQACSVIVCGISCLHNDASNLLARYCQGDDYHHVIKGLLNGVVEAENLTGRAFVDSAPVAERELARRAGLGWIGRNKMLINETFGSYLLLGEIICLEEFDHYDSPYNEAGGCGECRRCLDRCPSSALVTEGGGERLDARRCLSYITKRREELTQDEIEIVVGSYQADDALYIYGCDRCQECCPWNQRAKEHLSESVSAKNAKIFNYSSKRFSLGMSDWTTILSDDFKKQFRSTPLHLEAIKRNIDLAITNRKRE